MGLGIWSCKEGWRMWKLILNLEPPPDLNFLRKRCILAPCDFQSLQQIFHYSPSLQYVNMLIDYQTGPTESKNQAVQPNHSPWWRRKEKEKKLDIPSFPKIGAWPWNGNCWIWAGNIWRAYIFFSFRDNASLYWHYI